MARRTKLDWMKDLRGADLSGAEFRVLVVLATYSDRYLLKAHPGTKRLVEDTRMARSTVIEALKTLQEKGWIRLTEQGGNEIGKGIANTYSLHTPAIHKGTDGRTLKGPVSLTLVADQGSDSQGKGPMSGHQGSDSQAVKGLVDRTPSGNTSGPRSDPFPHHSAGEPSGSRPARAPRRAEPWRYDEHGSLTDESYDFLVEVLDPIAAAEHITVDGMLADGQHPQAIINTITKRRAAGA